MVEGTGRIAEGDEKVETFRYKISKSWGYKVQPREYSQSYCDGVGWGQMVATLILAGISQCIQMLKNQIVHLKLLGCCMPTRLQPKIEKCVYVYSCIEFFWKETQEATSTICLGEETLGGRGID